MSEPILESLVVGTPHPSLGAHADTYGRIIGDWAGEVRNYMLEGAPASQSIEIHLAWVLEGRAVQDTWITPARKDRGSPEPRTLDWYGSTLRVFDPTTQLWHAVWTDPISRYRIELDGKREGDDIVQLGTRGGRPIRWTFSSITPSSFVWHGHILHTDGVTWRLEVEVDVFRA